jgi:hypothetical protein
MTGGGSKSNSSRNLLETGVLGTRRASEEANLVSIMLNSASIRRKESVSEKTTELSSIVGRWAYLARGSPRLLEEISPVEAFSEASNTEEALRSSHWV